MKFTRPPRTVPLQACRQRGTVLFFALVALVAMSLAAVALIRSVDTSTIIAGNLAFKQSATTTGDSGLNAAVNWLADTQAASDAANDPDLSVLNNRAHPFNLTCLATRAAAALDADDPGCPGIIPGYHSSLDPAMDLFADATWNDTNSVLVGTDAATSNTVRYIIQRMCRNANQALQTAECLFAEGQDDVYGPKNVPLPQEICDGPGCPLSGQAPQIRITAKTTGPRSTVSYVQAFVY
ncbi:MAG: hypothetical protein PHF20_10045 [Halothiobacillaceae bacterium]|nr:hypothetical protein [Halothiobacillaceae bacterium]